GGNFHHDPTPSCPGSQSNRFYPRFGRHAKEIPMNDRPSYLCALLQTWADRCWLSRPTVACDLPLSQAWLCANVFRFHFSLGQSLRRVVDKRQAKTFVARAAPLN